MLIDALRPYGAERVALDLACEIQRRAAVVLVTYKGNGDQNSGFAPAGVTHVHLHVRGRGLRRLLVTAWMFSRLLLRTRPSAVIGFMPYANTVAAVCGALARVPVIATEHTVMSIAKYGGRERRLLHFAMRRYLRRVPAIVAVSHAVKNDLVEEFGAPAERIITIYDPVNIDRVIESARRGAQEVRKAASPDELRLVVVGKLKRAKGHEWALRALPLLPTEYRLYVVGDGPLLDTLQDEARSLGVAGRVEFVGWQTDAPAWLAAADVVWVPSLFEGFGLVLAEACALGCKVIPADSPGLAELAALLGCDTVPVGDSAALAAATLQATATRGKRTIAAGLRELAPSVVAERYLDVVARVSQSAGITSSSAEHNSRDVDSPYLLGQNH
jgi:glycosyltransferase involved in cell wall biosynthesis